jgi:hypothetical protein
MNFYNHLDTSQFNPQVLYVSHKFSRQTVPEEPNHLVEEYRLQGYDAVWLS